MGRVVLGLLSAVICFTATALKYDPAYAQYNLNENTTATNPLDYWGEWTGHQYTPSPSNWRFPFYTLFLDRFVNGDPTNDNINSTQFEHDPNSNQMRHGGDLEGLVDTLDYLHGMGVKGLYIAGSPFINQPWGYDQYSPLDLTLLDQHFGTLAMWRTAIDEIHARNMYVLLDSTFATMGDLIGFEGHLNTTTPFLLSEHEVQWKSDRQYTDFSFGKNYNATCEYPRFWLETGKRVDASVTDQMKGCYDSDFDQYGDTEAFGVFPDWRRQLSKFASVQDRLREWHEPVRLRLENFYCILIAQLDVDGFRYDKATQSTIDAMGYMNDAMRTCARRYGKENFFLPGEITGGNVFGSLYIGRGREPDQVPENLTTAFDLTNNSARNYFIRDVEYGALDAAAFHYTVYRTLTRFLGMDGNVEAGYDAPPNWVDMWNTFLLTNDFVNANTGEFDPRHMYGVTNQDVFRWPAIHNGVHRQLLGHFITTIHMPGIPLILWGEEQAFYVLDNTADNYLFGRQAMSAATAWETHGCYTLNSTQYFNMPLEDARNGCRDENVSKDHRDPSAPVRNVIRHMHKLRETYPVLNDGFYLQQLSNQTDLIQYPGSGKVPTETGMWSTMRSGFPGLQNLSRNGEGNQPVWLLYSNANASTNFVFDCSNNATALSTTALISPYDAGTTVKNLFYPYDEHTLETSVHVLGLNGSTQPNGCLSQLDMAAYDFRAYVPLAAWSGPQAMITRFSPGHDYRILSNSNNSESVDIEIQFSVEMDCDSVTNSITFSSKTLSEGLPTVNQNSVSCGTISDGEIPAFVGGIGSAWSFKATVDGLADGVHSLTVRNASAQDGSATNSNDRFLLRVGRPNNPVVFPRAANYSSTLLSKKDDGTLVVSHTATGADSWRYSTNWGSSFSDWQAYEGGRSSIQLQNWTGTQLQSWSGDHVRVEYFSRLAGSSDIVQEGDVDFSKQRRFPHMFLNGPYNQYGYDAGLSNAMILTENATWEREFMTEWPALTQISVWGMNPDGKPDQSVVLGDADGDSILDRLPPSSLASVILNITEMPPRPYLGWKIVVNDGNLRFKLMPYGNMWIQLALYILLWTVPVISGGIAVWAFMQSFYGVKFNEVGVAEKGSVFLTALRGKFQRIPEGDEEKPTSKFLAKWKRKSTFINTKDTIIAHAGERRTVLIATMEYDIEDWAIKIKIGGLGVMAQLMGKNLSHQDLIWVVPCVGGVDYPVDEIADPMEVTILNEVYEVKIQYHTLRNIKYVLLDSPVFRKQTKSEPYPPRMDDLSSAVYYSAWNQCIAQAIERFPIDLYHINDYHGTVAPLYLLPRTIPAALSLHNAEFQGLWPMRTKKERDEVSSVFNLSQDVVQKYVQFGEVFNLLHAGASYIRVNQEGFGAVGVSKKYGKRSYARYPIFWGLKKIGQLPNPDPSDTGEWDKQLPKEEDIRIDREFEAGRVELKRQAQEWANLDQNPKAELFVFVGRWSMQKGVDLIADVFPGVLAADENIQLICVGPVIDLYGKFAALKLAQLMKVFPGRVYSKPEFTALPPYIFSGAEFALIPSRDEPFGLVAVEFGRKGALGVGARVGGLGQMPGWWYTVESTTTSHLVHQFKLAIREALETKTETRAMMRARSAKQRFPVAQWVESLEILQSTAIRLHDKVATGKRHSDHTNDMGSWSGINSASHSAAHSRVNSMNGIHTKLQKLQGVTRRPYQETHTSGQLSRKASLGTHRGPGHVSVQDLHDALHTSPTVPEIEYEEPNIGMAISQYSDSDSDEEERGLEMPRTALQSRRGSGNVGLNMNAPSRPVSRHNEMVSPLGTPRAPGAEFELLAPPTPTFFGGIGEGSSRLSALSLDSVVGNKTDFNLQKVDPFFTDQNGAFTAQFTAKLATLDANNSEDTCIEEFLVKSEKKWFDEFRNAKLGRHSRVVSRQSSFTRERRGGSVAPSFSRFSDEDADSDADNDDMDQFMLGKDYVPPRGARNWMQRKLGDWPVYAFFMAFGQIIAANSYQITLLTGEVGQSAEKLYVIASIYLVTSICWWILFRRLSSVVCLSLPFFFYGLAFLLIGTAHFAPSASGRGWVQNVATGLYAVASSSGSIFFALNFGDEGGAQIKAWVFRACTIQGAQQIYIVALWYWGAYLNKRTSDGVVQVDPINSSWKITAITGPIAILMWGIGLLMWFGLPKYYRQSPGKMPSFYQSLLRRKVVMWFFVTVFVQNLTLSTPYGRNWSFLWSSKHASAWQVLLLVVFFFIGVWAAMLWLFGYLSKAHSWILPLFAIGLGAPRWAQIWWGTSNIGQFVPWAGGYTAGALASRSLWLWLGVLDSVQGVGLGMILLGTLTRVHVAAALISAQILGSIATVLARAVMPNRLGPGPISPDISGGISAIFTPWFWIALVANLCICAGFFLFYRKEQLSKP